MKNKLRQTIVILLLVCFLILLTATTVSASKYATYKVEIITGNEWFAGTDDFVFITLYGERGTSNEISLDNPGNDFEIGKTNMFSLPITNIGPIFAVKIRKSGDDSWYMSSVSVAGPDRKDYFTYIYNNWVSNEGKPLKNTH